MADIVDDSQTELSADKSKSENENLVDNVDGNKLVDKQSNKENTEAEVIENKSNESLCNDSVPELDENTTITNSVSATTPHLKPKIVFNKKVIKEVIDDDDILEVPVIKPVVDVIEVPDEDIGDTEVVSEDELPPPPDKEKVDGAEEVSDEELPAAPKPDLPPEAEDVSEDELDIVDKKKKMKEDKTGEAKEASKSGNDIKTNSEKKQTSQGDKTESSSKRKISEVEGSNDSDSSKNESTAKKTALETEKAPKKLPELNKYWKTVKDDPTDFTGWTYLLQYVDQETDVEAAEEAYEAFLSLYPYCYGYWRKFADYEKKKGTKEKCEDVFEQGLKAIPLSVDLWIHYLNYVKAAYAHDTEYIRKQYQRSVDTCGLEFRADRLWDNYIKWEIQGKEFSKAMVLFDRVISVPLQGHTTHFENFTKFIEKNSPKAFLSVDEFLLLRQEVLPTIKKTTPDDDRPPGDDEVPGQESSAEINTDEANAIKEKVITSRRKIHKENALLVAERWTYEEGIKRPYFHVKPLEKCQLKNWNSYLNFEVRQGKEERIIVLFERCLIACALYEEFWYKYASYLQGKTKDIEKARNVFTRACTIHHSKKLPIHIEWATFEEIQGNIPKCREILEKMQKEHPKLIELVYRRISLEKRHLQFDLAQQLYDTHLVKWKCNDNRHYFDLAIKYARFCCKILKNIDKAVEVIKAAIETEKAVPNLQDYTRLYFQLIDVAMARPEINIEEVVKYFDEMASRSSLNLEQKYLICHRKLEFLEEFGKDITQINNTIKELKELSEQVKKVSETQKPQHTPSVPLPPDPKKDNRKEGVVQQMHGIKKKLKLDKGKDMNVSGPPPLPTNIAPPNMPGPYYQPNPPFAPPNQFNAPPANAYGVNPQFQQFPQDPNAAYQQWYGQQYAANYNQNNWGNQGGYPPNYGGPPRY